MQVKYVSRQRLYGEDWMSQPRYDRQAQVLGEPIVTVAGTERVLIEPKQSPPK